jgi:hypothetical protein
VDWLPSVIEKRSGSHSKFMRTNRHRADGIIDPVQFGGVGDLQVIGVGDVDAVGLGVIQTGEEIHITDVLAGDTALNSTYSPGETERSEAVIPEMETAPPPGARVNAPAPGVTGSTASALKERMLFDTQEIIP